MDALAHLLICLAVTQPPADTTWLTDYEAAYKLAHANQRPLVILVGAKWCGWCPQTKKNATVVLKQHPDVVALYLDYDADRELCDAIKVSNSVPELIMYDWVNPSRRLVGSFSVEQFEKFMEGD